MILRGKLVTLRPITTEDAEITFRWRHGKRARFLQSGAETVQSQRAWIDGRAHLDEHNWIIEYQGAAVGMIALHDIDRRNNCAIIGRLLIDEGEKVGTAPVFFEAELLLCDFVFEQLGLHKLYGGIMEGHIGMIRTRLYLGYHQDGVLRDHLLIDGEYKDWIAVSLLEDEYRTICRPKLLELIELYSGYAAR